MTLTVRVNHCYTLWNVGSAVSNTLRNLINKKFNIRMNNHRKDANRENEPQIVQHFKLPSHNFGQHARFTLIEQLENVNTHKDLATLQLKKRDDFWIQNLKTLHPYGLNAEPNFPNQ